MSGPRLVEFVLACYTLARFHLLAMRKLTVLLIGIALVLPLKRASALDNGLAKTPPMGWNSWNKFGCNVSEDLIRSMADALVASGMRDAGYQYVVIDDCWQVSRDKDGNIVPDPQRFPHGMKALGDYIHSKGLKFGIYSDAGTLTCQKRPGSRGYEFQDARQYAAWGVDYLKYDWCNHGTQDSAASYSIMRDALLASGRPIVFSICEWGSTKPWLWAGDIGNLWRTTGDISDHFEGKYDYAWGMTNIVDQQVGIDGYAGPGHWNDPDMLEVGNGGMTNTEYQAHFSLWAVLAAPLMAGNDVRSMTPEIHDILTNKEVIAIDQDPLGQLGRRVRKDGDVEVWSRPLQDGSRAVVLFNRGKETGTIQVNWVDLGYPSHVHAAVHDLWQHKDVGNFGEKFSASVAPHGVVMIAVRP
jgi:alpha-galactosidase